MSASANIAQKGHDRRRHARRHLHRPVDEERDQAGQQHDRRRTGRGRHRRQRRTGQRHRQRGQRLHLEHRRARRHHPRQEDQPADEHRRPGQQQRLRVRLRRFVVAWLAPRHASLSQQNPGRQHERRDRPDQPENAPLRGDVQQPIVGMGDLLGGTNGLDRRVGLPELSRPDAGDRVPARTTRSPRASNPDERPAT